MASLGGVELSRVLWRQAGLVTRSQARECGIRPAAIRRRVASGAWSELRPGVYLVAGHRVSDEVRVRAAVLWGGPASLLSGPAAAFWHGFTPRLAGLPEITVPSGCSPRRQPGLRIRRRALEDADRCRHRGLAAVGRARTALDVAAARDDGSVFLDRVLQRHVRFPEVHRAYCRMLGHAGAAAAGRLLVAAADRADSAAERLLLRLLRSAGVDGWVLGHPFGPWTIDLAFPAEQVAVEVDGWAWHVDVGRFRADRRKGNALVAAGWNLLRFTWHDLDGAPDRC
ncbi:type IV toxin-antitoxin system AbiEi family antitoxin domain-containing protein [Pseudonocardia nantongensis]|uniref:type IV toxin-antitoxin system AbiEi family antitoxin domain-containing protein n=1 Tax=Pseudonocardia nantongensis TaxID=1181885 RepID=UPI00397E1582